MVTDHVVTWFCAFIKWSGGLFTLPAPPAFLSSLGGFVATAASYVSGTSVWMPWALMVAVIGVYVGALAAGIVIKLGRIVLSLVTLGGGSAA